MFGWVRLPPCKWPGEKSFEAFADGQEKNGLQHLESCTMD